MNNFRTVDRETDFLLPPSVAEWLPERHLARFVVEVVESLDLRVMMGSYRGSGSASYLPAMLLGLLIYGYATGVFSSRKLERATYDSVAFRFIAANQHPDHDTIATFRKRFLKEIEALFVRVLMLAREMGVLEMGTVALDGTKIHANASRHTALSYEYATKLEARLKEEVAQLLAKAEAADAADLPDGLSIPDELALREDRLKKLAEARAKIEERAKERYEREKAEYDAKMAAREAKIAETGKKPGGKPPQPPTEGPLPKDQINLTDEESRIMPVAGGGFDQCYNAQAAVATGSNLVVAVDVTQAPNDKNQIEPMVDKLGALGENVGTCERLLADTGYYSAGNVEACEKARIEPTIAMGRQPHHPPLSERLQTSPALPDVSTPDASTQEKPTPEDPAPESQARENPTVENAALDSAVAPARAPECAAAKTPTAVEANARRLKTPEGRELYALRKQTPEPVFGIIKSAMAFRQFSLRGLDNVRGEWSLVTMSYNIKRLFSLAAA